MAEPKTFDTQAFFVKDEDSVLDKLRKFRADGARKLHVVFDFDHTITASAKSSESVGTWAIVDEFVPPAVRDEHTAIYRHYRPIERSGTMTEEQAVEWWSKTLDLVCGTHFNLSEAEQGFLDAVTLRPGIKEVFAFCEQAHMPTIIISAGIKQLIDIFVQHYKLTPQIVLATELEVAADGSVTGWKRDTLVHALNKHEKGHYELRQICNSRPNAILIGDGPEDSQIVDGDENVLRICIMDPRNGESFDQSDFLDEAFKAGFDLVVGKSVEPISELMNHVTA